MQKMITFRVEAEISAEDLLKAAGQLSLAELERFVAQAIKLQAQRKAASLPQIESDLLLKINQGMPATLRKRYYELIERRRAETLTHEEYSELLRLTAQVENLQAERVEYLAELARIRKMTLTTLMKDLGIKTPAYG